MNREKLKEKEIEFLAKEYKKNPEFFERETLIDNAQFLEKIGIFIPSQKNLPLGYLKLWPQDFIVEEISNNGELQTTDIDSFFNKEKKFSESDPTIYATLVKCGLSSIEAIEEIVSLLKIDKKGIQFAGIKDKDAITSQLISFRRINIDSLKKINSPYLFLKNIYSGKGVIEIGSLKGNQFTVLIRTDDFFQEKNFLENLKKIKKEGFYNFFYLQRFGTPRLINFHWGCLILKGECQKAVFSFLCSPGERELAYFKNLRVEIKKIFGTWQKVEKILEPFPLIFKNEKKVVNYLKNNPQDFIGALNQIPEQVQLWLFAYVSLLFNQKISSYLKNGVKLPQKFPLILSKDENDWLFYKEILEKDKINSIPFKNLKSFPYVQWKKREIKIREAVEILDIRTIPGGVILSFNLPKAAYATTFLAHLFNLVSGLPPKNISPLPVDTKATLGEESLEELLNRFQEVIHSKTKNVFEKFE